MRLHQWQLSPTGSPAGWTWRCLRCGCYCRLYLTPVGLDLGTLVSDGAVLAGLTCEEAADLRPAWEVLES